jgi:hypothetical protein
MKNNQLSDLKQIYRQQYSEQKRAEYQAKKRLKDALHGTIRV